MAGTYYKYVERDADSQINWFEVGKGMTDMLTDVNRVREEKKAAYEQATRDDMNNLMDAPQGQNQDANDFINNYAHDMINQKKIDYDLFKRGQMSERDYTLKMQNGMDGTQKLFKIQKLYQDNYQKKMDGVTSGKLQAMNIFNMGMVEGYGDFNNSKATINPADGTVGIGLMENKMIDGKMVRVLSKNIANVNVITGKVLHDVPTFDVDKATSNTVANFGARKDILFEHAGLNNAGSITEYLGIDFLKTLTDPVDKKIVSDMNNAINNQVSSFFSNPYNLSSVLTENVGKYNAQSYTFDREEADNDPLKILVKVDPNTQMTTLDETGKNYEAQKKEASEWVRTDILSKMDQERKIVSTPSQLERRDEPEWKAKKKEEADAAVDAANMLGKLWYGNENQVQSSIDYIKGLKNSKGEILFKDVIRDPKEGVTVLLADGSSEKISFLDANGRPRTQEDFIASAGPLLVGQLDVRKATKSSEFKKNAKFNASSYGRGTTISEYVAPIEPLKLDSNEATPSLQSALPTGFKAKDLTPNFGNEVEITSPTGEKYVVKTQKSEAEASSISLGLQDFVNNELKKIKEAKLEERKTSISNKKQSKGTVTGGRTR